MRDVRGRSGSTLHRALFGCGALVFAGAVLHAAAQAPAAPTAWDGVYTDAQAARATAVFSQSCERCHTLTAEGTRPLAGEKFWRSYTQRTVGDLFAYVQTNMPNGSPGTLAESTYHDLVALILKSNGFPAGTAELGAASGMTAQIVPKDGGTELPANTLARVVGCLARDGREWVLTSATAPVRSDKTGPAPEDATVALGDRTTALKFVLTRLDAWVGHRVSASGMLIGAGGAEGINVTTVQSVGESCP